MASISPFIRTLKAKTIAGCSYQSILGSHELLLFFCPQKKVDKQLVFMQMHEINHFSKFYKISPRTQTLISIKSQCLYTNSVVLGVFIDQIKNWILEAYHQELGQDMTFIIWWLSFYFENIGT